MLSTVYFTLNSENPALPLDISNLFIIIIFKGGI